ncbi:MAG: O-antigen ligase family protein, partial [Bacillota bacterium]|nr:O-antigen ligase family protein [Bacillota bacterium]
NNIKRDLIFKFLYISSIIIFIIGIFQFLGHDPFKAEIIKKLIIPKQYADMAQNILYPDDPSASFRNSIYSTLYNSNVFGVYAALIAVFALTGAIFEDTAKRKILPLTSMALAIFSLINCYSRGAYFGGFIGIIVVITLTLKEFKLYYKSIILCLLCIAISVLPAILTGNGKFVERLSTIDVNSQDSSTGVGERIKDFKIKNSHLTLFFDNRCLNIQKKGGELIFTDTVGKVLTLDYSKKDEGYVINAENYRDFIVFADKDKLYIKKKNALLRFNIKNDTFIFSDMSGNDANIKPVESWLFNGRERLASGRGYIWSRALPLIKNNIFIGSGPDNFYYSFPQDDFLGKLKFMYNAYIKIDMAHNIYLQKAIETGLISLIFFIGIILYPFIIGLKALFISRGENKSSEIIGKANEINGAKENNSAKASNCKKNNLSISLIGIIVVYCVCGFFTDENICTMVVFWPMIGLLMDNKEKSF